MRIFSEELNGKQGPESVIIVNHSEAAILSDAIEFYCENNKRKLKAKKVKKFMDTNLSIEY